MKKRIISFMVSVLIVVSMLPGLQTYAAGTEVIKYFMYENAQDNNNASNGFRAFTSQLKNGAISTVVVKAKNTINSTKYTDPTDMALCGYGFINTIKTYTGGWMAVGSAFVGAGNQTPSPKDISDAVANGVIKMEVCLMNSQAAGGLYRNDFYVIVASYDSATQKYSYKGINLTNTNYVDCAAGYGEFMPVSVPISSLADLAAIPNDDGAPAFDFSKVVFVGLAYKPVNTTRAGTSYIDGYLDNIKIYSDVSSISTKFYAGTSTTGTPIETMTAGTISVKSEVAANASGKLIIAKFNTRKEMDFLEIIDVGQNKNPTVAIPSCQSTDIIKTFILDNLDNIKPMSGITQLPKVQ